MTRHYLVTPVETYGATNLKRLDGAANTAASAEIASLPETI
ncbi:MAG: hypothetical protein A4E65_02811 [Syntrophorhabdus sp. PtaU1.Bin153]|nr:MAG: hypothetical protein A4E65_02811 [Syntrophorhabdus sp. PtaU1.Bin153]